MPICSNQSPGHFVRFDEYGFMTNDVICIIAKSDTITAIVLNTNERAIELEVEESFQSVKERIYRRVYNHSQWS